MLPDLVGCGICYVLHDTNLNAQFIFLMIFWFLQDHWSLRFIESRMVDFDHLLSQVALCGFHLTCFCWFSWLCLEY